MACRLLQNLSQAFELLLLRTLAVIIGLSTWSWSFVGFLVALLTLAVSRRACQNQSATAVQGKVSLPAC